MIYRDEARRALLRNEPSAAWCIDRVKTACVEPVFMMPKDLFCKFLRQMRNYASWERKLYECGFDLASTPITDILDSLQLCMCSFNRDWDYDEKMGLSWIVEWCFGESPYLSQTRHEVEFDLTEPEALYDFLVFMNEHGWED